MNNTAIILSSLIFVSCAITTQAADETPLIEQFALTSPAFPANGEIPEEFTCKGADTNPRLLIHNTPQGTRSLAIAIREPANPITPWTHWLVYNIRPGTHEIREGAVPGTQALNDFGNFYYGGPCVFDAAEHRFEFTVYALNTYLDNVNEGATFDVLEKAMKGKIIAKATLTGTYQNRVWGQDDKPL